MLSQCPDCRAIFNVSKTDFEAHHGLVRCGRCRGVFHAAENEVADIHQTRGAASPTPDPKPAPEDPDPATPQPQSAADEAPEPALDAVLRGAREPAASSGPEPYEPAPPDEGGGRALQPGTAPHPDAEAVEDVEPEPAQSHTKPPDLPGDIAEEILIEAPPTIPLDVDETEVETQWPDAQTDSADPAADGAGPAPAGLQSPYRARDIRMVELPQPRPFKTASLSLLSVFLVLLLIWQVRTFYFDELAQVPLLRPYIELLCRPLGCTLPARRDFAQIDLVRTGVSINREVPGALEIEAVLINNAHFPQPYPPLRVTLTDREGQILGRRTYLPGEYRPDSGGEPLPIRQERAVTINLAHPERDVVGYEVELVTPRRN